MMQNFKQHGKTSTFEHCFNVAVMSYIIATRFRINVCMQELLIGAMLHDFYLYDWHDGRIRPEGIHGFSHPKVAAYNANIHFCLTDKVHNIIESHMFPLTLMQIPRSKEAVIVCIADKICAIKEYTKK